jgi:uncharacterized membrane protein
MPDAYLATAHVPRKANNATTTAEGTLELSPPAVLLTRFGPKIASNNTKSHVATIATDVSYALSHGLLPGESP